RQDRRGQVVQLRPKRDAEAIGLRGRVAEGQRPAPGRSADESCRKCDFSDEPISALMPAERPVDKRGKRPPQRQLVADRLRKLEPLEDLRRRAGAGDGTAPSPPPPAPGAAAA